MFFLASFLKQHFDVVGVKLVGYSKGTQNLFTHLLEPCWHSLRR